MVRPNTNTTSISLSPLTRRLIALIKQIRNIPTKKKKKQIRIMTNQES